MNDVVLGSFCAVLPTLSFLFIAGDRKSLLKKKTRLKKAFENNRPLRFLTMVESKCQQTSVLKYTTRFHPAGSQTDFVVFIGFVGRQQTRG
jgi:hypothetical protein